MAENRGQALGRYGFRGNSSRWQN